MTHTDDQTTDDLTPDDWSHGTPTADGRGDGSVPKSTTFGPDENVSEVIVLLVSRAKGLGPAKLTPLYEVVEPDALEALVSHGRRTRDPAEHRVQFRYEGFDVIVRGDGRVRLEPTER